MSNILHGEFYKLRKNKCFYICCLAIAVSVLFVFGILNMADSIQKNETENGSYGVTLSEDQLEDENSIWDQITIMDMEQYMFGNFAAIIAAVFTSIFVIGEYGNGAVKNIVGKGYARWKIFAAKYISTITAVILMMLIMTAEVWLCWIAFRGTKELTGEVYQNMFKYTGMQMMFSVVLIGIVIVVSEVCRNLGAGISIGFGIIVFSPLVADGLDLLFHRWEISPSNYWIVSLIQNCPLTQMGNKFVIHAVITSIIWFLLSLTVGIVHFQKADIK